MVIALLALAFAQDDDPEVSEVIIIYGQEQVEVAKERVMRELYQLGYTKKIRKNGAVVMRHRSAWKGDVWLHEDGWMQIRRQPLAIHAPQTSISAENSVGAWATCLVLPFRCVRLGGQFVSKRKFMAVETRTAGSVSPEVAEWGNRLADLQVGTKVEVLPVRLEALWHRGVPLEGDLPLLTVEERKFAILRYWETRTDTIWGETVRQAIEAFIRGEIQGSETPFTEREIRAFNRRSHAGRSLSLERQP